MSYKSILTELGLSEAEIANGTLSVQTPVDGSEFASVTETTAAEMTDVIGNAKKAFGAWRQVPGPRRGELVRLFAEELRVAKEDLGRMVSIEAGKSPSEGLGEVQEMIDICDFAAVGTVGQRCTSLRREASPIAAA